METRIKWHFGELFPRYYFILTNSWLAASKVVKVYNGRGDVENRIKEGKNTLRWDKTSCHRFPANEARLKIGFLADNLLPLIRRFYLCGEDARRSIEWIITRLVKAGARVVYHARRWNGVGMFMRRQLVSWDTITGLCLAGSAELAYT